MKFIKIQTKEKFAMKKKLRIVHLISGGGSTSWAILEAQKPGGKLHGLVETVAIISSKPGAGGIQKAIDAGFPREHIYVLDVDGDLGAQLLEILDVYKPDYFCQLGWEPYTPDCVTERFQGLNQHLGPGGRFMYYQRRIFAHRWFCQKIGERRLIPIFCQYVYPHRDYDEGNVVYVRFEDYQEHETDKEISDRLLLIEHEVQIEGIYLLATGRAKPIPVPRVYQTDAERAIMDQARLAAKERYPRLMKT